MSTSAPANVCCALLLMKAAKTWRSVWAMQSPGKQLLPATCVVDFIERPLWSAACSMCVSIWQRLPLSLVQSPSEVLPESPKVWSMDLPWSIWLNCTSHFAESFAVKFLSSPSGTCIVTGCPDFAVSFSSFTAFFSAPAATSPGMRRKPRLVANFVRKEASACAATAALAAVEGRSCACTCGLSPTAWRPPPAAARVDTRRAAVTKPRNILCLLKPKLERCVAALVSSGRRWCLNRQ
mmetsp:Transcript_40490/g.116388  ORF Transcript_40490/g.116388 Transcript_40490/m.116388 type:complete len:237 (+) Transcript_40490:265-975(+)